MRRRLVKEIKANLQGRNRLTIILPQPGSVDMAKECKEETNIEMSNRCLKEVLAAPVDPNVPVSDGGDTVSARGGLLGQELV